MIKINKKQNTKCRKNYAVIFSLLKKSSKQWKNPFVTEPEKLERSPFITLISCILSLRTKDEVTAKASLRLLKKYNTPEKLLKLSGKKIEELIYPVGFYKTKAKRIKEICRVLIGKYDGKVPDDFDELMELKGVGPKTAGIVLVYGYKRPVRIPADVHVHIIANRLGWVKTKAPEKTEEGLMRTIPKKYWYDLNDLLVQFGQNICITVSPWCSKCPIETICPKIGVTKKR